MLLAILAAWLALARADTSTTEDADSQYRFTFRFPADWPRQELPTPGEGGEVRLAARSAARAIFVLAIVTPTGPAITREEFERRPDRDALVEKLTTVAGTHVFPFGEPYAITLMVVMRAAGATPTEVERAAATARLASGERGMKRGVRSIILSPA